MKKMIFCLIILISVSTIAYAQEIPGRPGRYIMKWAHIDTYFENCYALYENVVDGNESIGTAPGQGSTMVVINKNKIMATCKFTDISGTYEANAEVGVILWCQLKIPGAQYEGGTGTIIAAANHGNEPGGTVTMHCTFDPDDLVVE